MSKVKLKSNESALTYYEGLPKLEKERYDAKISVIGGVDPYEMKSDWSNKVELLPDISYPDIVNYLVFKLSSYTLEHLKAYKSLTAYNYFVSGWVREVSTTVLNGHRVVKAKVLHSQCLGLKPLDVWVISEAEGTVLSGHCKCMAGMGEVCSHVAAVLFAVEATVKIRNSKTVTEEKAYWLLPTSLKKVEYKTAADIDFTSASTAKKRLDSAIESTCSSVTPKTPRTPARTNKTQKPTDSEI